MGRRTRITTARDGPAARAVTRTDARDREVAGVALIRGSLEHAMRSEVAIVLALTLAGCVSREERAEVDMRDAKATCAAAGLREGTREFAQCALAGFREAQAAHEAARHRAAEGGAKTVQTPPPQPPGKPVMCQPRGTSIVCQ